MNKCKFIIVAIVCVILSGCAKGARDISVTSFRVVSIAPQGLASVVATVEVGVHNPISGFVLTDAQATLRLDGEDVLYFNGDQLMVEGKCDREYTVPLKGRIAEGFNPFQLLKLLDNKSVGEDLTVSLHARVSKRGGIGKVIEMNDIPMKNFIDRQ